MKVESIKSIFKEKGYVWNGRGDFDLNLIGVRCDDRFDADFTDNFFCVYSEKGQEKLIEIPWTTMLGKNEDYKKPETVSTLGIQGTMVLKEGQYLNCWQFIEGFENFHKSPHLWQIGRVEVYINPNKDFQFNRELPVVGSMIGVNIHSISLGDKTDNWVLSSQGSKWVYFKELISLIRKSEAIYGKQLYGYTLLNKEDFQTKRKVKNGNK